jgi:hypothetical protein
VSQANKSGFYRQIPLHPEFPTLVATSREWNPGGHTMYKGRLYPAFPTLKIRMFVYCRDTEQQIFEVEFDRDDFRADDGCEKDCRIVADPRSLAELL